MIKVLLLFTIFLSFNACADLDEDTFGKVLETFPAPAEYCYGLASDGTYLYTATSNLQTTNIVYQIDPKTGNELNSFPAPGDIPDAMTFDGTNLRILSYDSTNKNYRLYTITTTGSILGSVVLPVERPGGITFQDDEILISDYNTNKIYRFDQSLNAIETIPSIGTPYAIAMGNNYLWTYTSDGIWAVDLNGNFYIDKYNIADLQWKSLSDLSFHDNHLWALGDNFSRTLTIFKISLE